MDPQACLERWRTAVADKDKREAREARNDLAQWLARGGFWPEGLTNAELAILKRYHSVSPPVVQSAQA